MTDKTTILWKFWQSNRIAHKQTRNCRSDSLLIQQTGLLNALLSQHPTKSEWKKSLLWSVSTAASLLHCGEVWQVPEHCLWEAETSKGWAPSKGISLWKSQRFYIMLGKETPVILWLQAGHLWCAGNSLCEAAPVRQTSHEQWTESKCWLTFPDLLVLVRAWRWTGH